MVYIVLVPVYQFMGEQIALDFRILQIFTAGLDSVFVPFFSFTFDSLRRYYRICRTLPGSSVFYHLGDAKGYRGSGVRGGRRLIRAILWPQDTSLLTLVRAMGSSGGKGASGFFFVFFFVSRKASVGLVDTSNAWIARHIIFRFGQRSIPLWRITKVCACAALFFSWRSRTALSFIIIPCCR